MLHRSFRRGLTVLTMVLLISGIGGCGSDTAETGRDGADATGAAGDAYAGEQSEHTAPSDEGDTSEIEKALASLSPEDRAAAEKQENCLVGDEPLGSMGPPVKVTVNGQEVFLCCEGCESEIQKDPAKYLAKLKED